MLRTAAARVARTAARASLVTSARRVAPVARPAVTTAVRAIATKTLEGYPSTTIPGTFGQDSFNERAMKEYLPKDVYKQVRDCLDNRKPMKAELVDRFAQGLLRWAEDRGATHFTHWFQPLTNYFACKHDSLIKREGDHVITNLTGKMLSMGEPDGSSFPSGGLRETHTARGYTVWDPSAPCFISHHGTGTTLNIPCVFFSWKGEALDEKTPLLRSTESLGRECLRLLHAMGEKKHKRCHADSGVEQEFFLIDKEYYRARTDLMQTGRTLVGADPPKGQAMDDQYFGSFSDRSLQMLNEAEVAMWKMGIPQTTRHREVAPGQYEMAPVFCPTNVSGDYNLLQMDVLTKTAEAHGLAVLFHEKPFANLNGSGKHNNYSIGTDRIGTLYEPGPTPEKNLLFMTFLAATVRALDVHADILRFAVAGPGNDHRLGGHEAPPAIISMYLGSDISTAVQKFLGEEADPLADSKLDLGISLLPEFRRDPTDRNRTSPFAFTGNKFEFRAVGSSHNPSRSSTFLNVAMADSLRTMAEAIEAKIGDSKPSKEELKAITTEVVADTLRTHRRIMFDGDNYSDAWREEAERRGLPNYVTTPQAYKAFDAPKNYELFSKFGVLSERELGARVSVALEEYNLRVASEAEAFINLINSTILPSAFELQTKVAGSMLAANSASGSDSSAQKKYLDQVTAEIDGLLDRVDALQSALDSVPHGDQQAEADYYCDNVLPLVNAARTRADTLENLCDASNWPLPTYHEMLFHQS